MDKYIKAFKNYIKTIGGYLNPNRLVVDKDIDDIFELHKSLAEVIYVLSVVEPNF